jgi:hypothetical protein
VSSLFSQFHGAVQHYEPLVLYYRKTSGLGRGIAEKKKDIKIMTMLKLRAENSFHSFEQGSNKLATTSCHAWINIIPVDTLWEFLIVLECCESSRQLSQ